MLWAGRIKKGFKMKLLLAYSLRNLLARRLTTLLTAGGMALVVFAFAAIVMLAEGLEKHLVDSGSFQNAVRHPQVLQFRGAKPAFRARRRPSWRPSRKSRWASRASAGRQGGGGADQPAQARFGQHLECHHPRSLGSLSRAASQVRVAAGRLPRPGSAEIMVGEASPNVSRARLERYPLVCQERLEVVGIFDAGNTGFSSEIWVRRGSVHAGFPASAYSSVIFRMHDRMDSRPSKAESRATRA